MDIRSKLDKVRALGAAGTVKMAVWEWLLPRPER